MGRGKVVANGTALIYSWRVSEDNEATRVIEGVPDDARLVDVHYDRETDRVVFIIDSNVYPEGALTDVVNVVMKTVNIPPCDSSS